MGAKKELRTRFALKIMSMRVMKAHIEHELLGEEVVGNHSTVLSLLFLSIVVLLLEFKMEKVAKNPVREF